MTQTSTKVIVTPVLHEAQGRVFRTTWSASVVLRTDTSDFGDPNARIRCGHLEHRTTDAAAKCGVETWKRLPR